MLSRRVWEGYLSSSSSSDQIAGGQGLGKGEMAVEGLGKRWPAAYWDDWMREPQQRRGRHVIRPEVIRAFDILFLYLVVVQCSYILM
jgi:hypothetical protein